MSGGGFSFGQPTAAAAAPFGSFGAPKTAAAAAPATAFGIVTSTPAAAGGGFSFGTPAPAQPAQGGANPGGGFSFGTPAKSTALPPAFNLATPQPAETGLTLGATTAPATGFTLGGGLPALTTMAAPAGGGFSFGAAVQPQVQPQAPAVTAAATSALGGLTLGGFSFGSAKVQVTTAVAAPPAAAAGGGFVQGGGGFSFGIKPASTPAPVSVAPATQAAPTLGTSLFAMAIPTSTPNPAATGFTLGGTMATPASSVAPATTTGGLNVMLKPLGAATVAPTLAATPTTTALVTGIATGFPLGRLKPTSVMSAAASLAAPITTTAMPPTMSYAQLESLINKWSLELEDQERHFLQQATQVNAWDRMLVENGEKITSLHKEMEKVKLDQRRLNQELDFILSQQKELGDLQLPLEESVKEQSTTIYMQNADEERERTYKLAENVDVQLKRMSQDLKEIIEHLNTSSGPSDNSDPLQQICKILNAHMDSLQWVDQNSVLLQRRVEDVSKMCDTQRKEQEKTFRLTFD
ncbi:hypothetical protein CRUP_003546 [Coryphaenoides rupestris]|nr:hypothetical protein CRUP_003546 [Coryphaenoides rupestris]